MAHTRTAHSRTAQWTLMGLAVVAALASLSVTDIITSKIQIAQGAGPSQVQSINMTKSQPTRQATTRILGGTPEQREVAAAEMEHYVDAGLDLPTLEIQILGESECGGNDGSFSKSSETWYIKVCSVRPSVIRHELGHAWAAANLSDVQRDAYVSRWGFESWNAKGTAWQHRGSEDAADTLAWGLNPMPISVSGIAADGPIAQRLEAFQMLTGLDSPRVEG